MNKRFEPTWLDDYQRGCVHGWNNAVDEAAATIDRLRAEVEGLKADMRDAIGAIRSGSSGSAIVIMQAALRREEDA
jgi:hypothetical protein